MNHDNDSCGRCSKCSSHEEKEEHHQHQQNCHNYTSSSNSGISREEESKFSHCSTYDHVASLHTASSPSYSSTHHHNHSSENSSWQEEMKSSSTISFSSSSNCSSTCQHHSGNKNEYSSEASKQNLYHKNTIQPIGSDTKSMTSSSSKKKNKTRPKYSCFRSNATSKISVFFIFFIIVLGAATTFFCWPRTPQVSMGGGVVYSSTPPDWWAGTRQPIPSFVSSSQDIPVTRTSLRATWQINVTLDNHDNWIPTHIKSLDFVLMDSLTLAKFAWASTGMMDLQPGVVTPLSLTFSVNYQAPDHMDPTFQNLYNACGPLKSPNDQRPALNVLMKVGKASVSCFCRSRLNYINEIVGLFSYIWNNVDSSCYSNSLYRRYTLSNRINRVNLVCIVYIQYCVSYKCLEDWRIMVLILCQN